MVLTRSMQKLSGSSYYLEIIPELIKYLSSLSINDQVEIRNCILHLQDALKNPQYADEYLGVVVGRLRQSGIPELEFQSLGFDEIY